MKTFQFHSIRLFLPFMIVVLSITSVRTVFANDYLEKDDHYKVYATGSDVIHFVIPVWSYGRAYDYYNGDGSYASYQINGQSNSVRFADFSSDRYDENEKENGKGTAYLKLKAGEGSAIVTSMYNGVNQHITAGQDWFKMIVKQKEADDHPMVTFLEFDWFPPAKLDSQKFTIKLHLEIKWSKSGNVNYTKDFDKGSNFTSNKNLITPQLYTPYLYTLNETGVAGYGYAAIPFMVFNDPKSYYTSFEPSRKITLKDRAGTIYIPTSDTIIGPITATFTVVPNAKQPGETEDLPSTTVKIPPYHRIHDFSVQQELDSTGCFSGNNILRWSVRNPGLRDLLEGDYFEIQRASDSSFSDAQSITVVPLRRSDTVTDYRYADYARETWSGNARVDTVAIDSRISAHEPKFLLTDTIKSSTGNDSVIPMAEIDVTIASNSVHVPAVPIYYRIRRASSSVWGWDTEFAKKAQIYNLNFLAPLAKEQPLYELDADYANNRKVNFRFKLENAKVTAQLPSIEECTLHYDVRRIYNGDSVSIKPEYQRGYTDVNNQPRFRVLDPDGREIIHWVNLSSGTRYKFPRYSTVQVKYVKNSSEWSIDNSDWIYTFTLNTNVKVTVSNGYSLGLTRWSCEHEDDKDNPETGTNFDDLVAKLKVKDSMYSVLKQYYSSIAKEYGFGSMWDKTASLVLRRTIVGEMGEVRETQEFIIPADSIRREPITEGGNPGWIATFSDYANKGCTHYKYSVRIDQSRSDLHVANPDSQLLPVEIKGPELYFEEVADITSFTASIDNAEGNYKNGVLLTWATNINTYDEFVLRRVPVGSSDTTIVYTGLDNNFFDESAIPSQFYEYIIEAIYTCNGKRTVSSKTARGRRSKYGEIGGKVLQTDNSGMNDVTVALQDPDGNVIRTMKTDPSGNYKFDSVSYLSETATTCYVKLTLKTAERENDSYFSHTEAFEKFKDSLKIQIFNPDGSLFQDWTTMDMKSYNILEGSRVVYKNILYDNFARNCSVYDIGEIKLNKNTELSLAGPYKDGYGNRMYMWETRVDATSEPICNVNTMFSTKNYIVVPTHQYGTFSFNNTSAGTAAVTLSPDNAVVDGIDFVNTRSTRLSGRVLYKNSTIPVSGASFLLNGIELRRNGNLIKTGPDGNFELLIPTSQPCRLQVVKEGHVFEGGGILRVKEDEEEFALTKPLDGVRFYDMTKVRLVGRVAGGNDQRDLPRGFGYGTNNLGDNLQLVLQLEGDNTSQIVHDPDDLSKETINDTIRHYIYRKMSAQSTDSATSPEDFTLDSIDVGSTSVQFERKRIIVRPDSLSGEFAVDLFPVKYKVVQATANGYATLLSSGQGSETFDLTNAPLDQYEAVYVYHTNADSDNVYVTMKSKTDSMVRQYGLPRGILRFSGYYRQDGDYVKYNAVYDRIYHSPVQVTLTQVLYGLERDGYGEQEMDVSSYDIQNTEKVRLYEKDNLGNVNYLLGYPVFIGGRKYQFTARAFESYYYNNDPQSGKLNEVPQRGGSVTIHNGMHNASNNQTYQLDETGRNKGVLLTVDLIDTENKGANALRTVSTVLETEGSYVENSVFQAFISGTVVQRGELMSTEAKVALLDIVRDPGGNESSAWVEEGSTYTLGYTEKYDFTVGVKLEPTWGYKVSQDIGVVAAPAGAGTYIGSTYTTNNVFSIPIPIEHEWKWAYKHNYSITTTQRISTSSGKAKTNVSGAADVFFGTMINQLAGKAKTVSIIDDSMYIARQPAIQAGIMKILAQGKGGNGKKYYLVTGQKVVLGTEVRGNFVYTQEYILNTLIPKLALERQNLLMDFPDEETAKRYANAIGEPVYWNLDSNMTSATDSIPRRKYKMINPDNDKLYNDRIAALNHMIFDWVLILYENEKEKVEARLTGNKVGTWSVSNGASISHSETYSAGMQYSELPQGWGNVGYDAASTASSLATEMASKAVGIAKFFKNRGKEIGKTVASVLEDYTRANSRANAGDAGADTDPTKNQNRLGTQTAVSEFSLVVDPSFDFGIDMEKSHDQTNKKSTGFTLGADLHGDITVSVYRARLDSVWELETEDIRTIVGERYNDSILYGSYVFFTEAGSTYCPHEVEDKTNFYNPGTIIANETQWVDKPELSIDRYEQTNVMPDKRAVFKVTMMNNGQVQTGIATKGTTFNLFLAGNSNPNGAKIYMDGAPLISPISMFLLPGEAATKVMEVERGIVDDYDNLQLLFSLADCGKTNTSLSFSVHFLPVSTDVNIAMPRQNWVMNTLSQKDSVGYYLPVDIDGFDIHHKNFDHIEFQYKLSTQSEEAWVNLCSFFASDSLYELATGNKAMIRNGRIEPFRFYGERDPIEQRYDLRAVSFCRHGSGFVTKSSPVISGVKDTRPPRVFGEPEPANAILGVGDNLKLRFNEPIAGNYLDEDNNFQIMGVTNSTGITTNASVHFTGMPESYANSQVSRSLSNRSFSIDMLVKPTNPKREQIFFEHGMDGTGVKFGLTADNKLQLQLGTFSVYSKQLEYEMLDFTRVILTYDNEDKKIRFYAGTADVTDTTVKIPFSVTYDLTAPLIFGRGLEGNMLEVRLWSEALTQEEIAATDRKYLTGYERELVAYYQMREGQGDKLSDKAGGATLQLHNATWNLPEGISLAIKANQKVQLAGNLLSRSNIYDETLMLWFKINSDSGTIFSANYGTTPSIHGTRLFVKNGKLQFTNDGILKLVQISNDSTYYEADTRILTDVKQGEWYHFVLSVNRTFNNVSIFINGQITQSFPAIELSGISGAMYLGGDGFDGNIDEFIMFEQALPKVLVETFNNLSPVGDEMGLMAYLPFEEQKENKNRVPELVFSINDKRQIKNSNGEVLQKEIPLIVKAFDNSQQVPVENLADKANYAPVRNYGLLSKYNFDWAFNQDELLINLNMLTREINKQTVCITVRDVEDLNGNPMQSPVTWVAYVDKNSLTWEDPTMKLYELYNTENSEYNYRNIRIINNSGKRHQFTIESIPEWLTVDQSYGSIQPEDDYTIRFTYDVSLPVGTYTDLVYLTDENGLSEPLKVIYNVVANCPWANIDKSQFDNSMSLRGQVHLENTDGNYIIDTDNNDIIGVFCNGTLVGKANNTFDPQNNTSYVYLTIYGNNSYLNAPLYFKLWRASTGKVHNLTSDSLFAAYKNNALYGYAPEKPIILKTFNGATQQIFLNEGWNWISFNLNPQEQQLSSFLNDVQNFTSGDFIKTPSERQFAEFIQRDYYSYWSGSLKNVNFRQMYMIYVKKPFNLNVEGIKIGDDQRYVTLNKGWNSISFPLDDPLSLRDALADYLDYAQEGDVIKSKDAVAVFSENKRWEGSLQTMKPGQGYLFYRSKNETVTMNYYSSSIRQTQRKLSVADIPATKEDIIDFHNPNANSNMTLVATVKTNLCKIDDATRILAYVGQELSGIARPQIVENDTLFFITISNDNAEPVTFRLEQNGDIIANSPTLFDYVANNHRGSLKLPVIIPFDKTQNAKLTFPANVQIYAVTGQLVGTMKDAQNEKQIHDFVDINIHRAGVYTAVIKNNNGTQVIKIIKQ